jgi:beta-lactamase superfamily II metal-dependent hydrolase
MGISNRLEAVVLNVGHGNAAVIREGEHCVVIDAASRSHLLEFLREEKIDVIDLVLISHSDKDHIEGLIALITSEIVLRFVRVPSDANKKTALWDDLLVALEDARRRGQTKFEVGLSIRELVVPTFSRIQFFVVAPSGYLSGKGAGSTDRSGRSITSNSTSVCIRVLCDQKPVLLLTGDLDNIGLEEAARSNEDFSAPVLVFPHHGGSPGRDDIKFTNDLLAMVKPDRVIFSMGRNMHMNPRIEIVTAIRLANPIVKIACTQLSKHCLGADQDAHLKTLQNEGQKHRRSKFCCAGHIRIDLPLALTQNLFDESHSNFVQTHLPNGMCIR